MGNTSNKTTANHSNAEMYHSTRVDEQTRLKELDLPTIADLQDVTSSQQRKTHASRSRSTGTLNDDDYRSSLHDSAGTVNSDVSEGEDVPHCAIPEGHFVHTDSIEHALYDTYGPHTRARHITFSSVKLEQKTADELVKIWKSPEASFKTENLRKHIIASRIPNLRTQNEIVELSKFLKIDDQYIREAVISSLQSVIYLCDDCVDKEIILEVEMNVWRKLTTQQDHVFDLGILNLQLWSCLLCDPDKDDTTNEKILKVSQARKNYIKDNIMTKCRTDSGDLFKSMARFHEYFPKGLQGRSHLPLGKNVKRVLEESSGPAEILGLVKDAHFCDSFVHIFSVLKQIHLTKCDKLLKYLKEIFPELITGRCDKQKQTLIMLLIKGCLYLLQTIYKNGDIKVGNINNTPTKDLADLILSTLENQRHPTKFIEKVKRILALPKDNIAQETRNQLLLDEISQLIFHPSVSVRDPIYHIHSQYNSTSLPQRFIEEIERSQANACLQVIHASDLSHTSSQKHNKFSLYRGSHGGDKVLIRTELMSYDELHRTTYIQEYDRDEHPEKLKHLNNLNMLRKLRSNQYIVELYAFQIRPLPWYYITEDNLQMTLQRYVLQRRETKNWFCDRQLCSFLMDILGGLSSLHKQKVLLRDLTLINFFIDKGGSVKVGDLSLACEYKKGVPVSYMHPGDIPTLWTSPEALLDGIYTPQSDVWSLGLVISTLWTHGCEPFTEHLGLPVEDVMRIMLFGDGLLPFQWQCIPDAMYTLIKMCMKTHPLERIELDVFQLKLQDFMKKLDRPGNYEDWSDTKIEQIQAEDGYYPTISSQQIKRLHKPERGIPTFIQIFRKDKGNAYMKHSWEEWKNEVMSKSKGVNAEELQDRDELTIQKNETYLVVEEQMSESSAQRKVPQIDTDVFGGRNRTNTTIESDGTAYYKQTSTYEDCNTLLDTARKRLLDGDSQRAATSTNSYLRLLLQVAKHIKSAHVHGWISADIRSKSFLVRRRTHEVFPCRVGRMINKRIPKTRVYRDSKRWLPPETLIHGIYSESGDVYMWASLVYEVLTLYELGEASKKRDSVPYHTWPEDKLEIVKQKGEYLPQPVNCPDWLYGFLKRCWHPDRTLRPTIDIVIEHLNRKIPLVDDRLQYDHPSWHQPEPCSTPGQRIKKAKGWKSRINKFRKSVVKKLSRNRSTMSIRRQRSTINEHDDDVLYGALNPVFDDDVYTTLKQSIGSYNHLKFSDRIYCFQNRRDADKMVGGSSVRSQKQGVKMRTQPGRRAKKNIRDRAESKRKNNASSSSSGNSTCRRPWNKNKRKARGATMFLPGTRPIQDDQTCVKTMSLEIRATPSDDATLQTNGLCGTSNMLQNGNEASHISPTVLIYTRESNGNKCSDLTNAVKGEPPPDYLESADDHSGCSVTRGNEADSDCKLALNNRPSSTPPVQLIETQPKISTSTPESNMYIHAVHESVSTNGGYETLAISLPDMRTG